MENDLNRFLKAQEEHYENALSEIKSGRKTSHWMWFIFPQFKGLRFSETSKFYSIKSIIEAKEYLNHPILGARLKEISTVLIDLDENDAYKIFGSPDNTKLNSSMTLFSKVDESDEKLFDKVIFKFFKGEVDAKTNKVLEKENQFYNL
jgi:uncharacterized protein (DUF1810 family)